MTMPGLPKVPAAERIDVDATGKFPVCSKSEIRIQAAASCSRLEDSGYMQSAAVLFILGEFGLEGSR